MKFVWVYLSIFILTIFLANAQLGPGCYVGGVLYTSTTSKSNRHFYRTPGDMNSVCGFIRTGSNNTCRLYNGGDESINSSYTAYSNSFSNDWDEISCPIDSYVWVLLLTSAVFSFFRLKPLLNTK